VTDVEKNKLTEVKWLIVSVIFLSAFTGLGIGLLRDRGLDSSALLYIGVPVILALVFAFTTPASKSVLGTTLKGITFVILISGPLLQEGFICMIMAAPIFYIVGALVAWSFDYYRKKEQREDKPNKLNVLVIPALLLAISVEGTTNEFSFERNNVVEHTKVIDGSVVEVKDRLGVSRSLATPNSLFAKLFPRPDVINAEGLSIGDKHWAEISYFKWIYWNEKRGITQFKIIENQKKYIKLGAVSDSSYISSYLKWGDTEIFFEPLSDTRTKVTWRVSFKRKIDPAWYVQPLQRYAAGLMTEQLVLSLQ